ncbi:MAG: Flp family type IVb pilin [Hyphomicrobiales bacterium]|nr:Flp family type IVb pilin [Hyphomicrobiales bacterium]
MTRFDLKEFIADESGASAVEYGLIAGLVSVAGIAGLHTMGGSLQTLFTDVAGAIVEALS